MRTVQSTIGHRECNDHSLITIFLIATYFYRIIRYFCIRLSLIVLCHTFITDTIESQNIAIILCMYTNHNNAHHCYHTHISVVISGDGWFYDFGDSNRAFKRDCTVYTGY